MTETTPPIQTELSGHPPVLHVRGDIDASTSAALTAAVDDLASASDGPLVIDLSKVTFMDSSGLSVLINAHQRGFTIVVRQPSEVVRRVVELTGLEAVLVIEP